MKNKVVNIRRGKPIDAEIDLGLKPGDRLICRRGFLFNESLSGIPAHVPDRAIIEQVYPRFIVLRAEFYSNHGKEYRECLSTAAFIAGDIEFQIITGKDE